MCPTVLCQPATSEYRMAVAAGTPLPSLNLRIDEGGGSVVVMMFWVRARVDSGLVLVSMMMIILFYFLSTRN